MASAQRFSEQFWGEDGFEAISGRLKDSEGFLKDAHAYLQERSKIDMEYAKKLQALAKSAAGTKDVGTFKTAWQSLKNETEALGTVHFQFVDDLRKKVVDPLSQFKDEYKATREGHVKEAEKAIKNWKEARQKLEKARDAYYKACKAMEQSEKDQARDSSNPLVKEKKKQEQLEAVQKNAKAKETSYKEYVTAVDYACSVRETYIDHLTITYESFQTMEEERIDYWAELLKAYVETSVAMVVSSEDSCRRLLSSVDLIDRPADIETVINTKHTGSKYPAAPTFVEYGEQPPKTEEEDASPARSEFLASTRSTGGAAAPETPIASSPARFLGSCKALHDYTATEDSELSFTKGSVIRVTQKDASGWWCGVIEGRVGIFPSNFVTEQYE